MHDQATNRLEVTTAFAAANLINLGFDVGRIPDLVDQWVNKQLRHSKLQALDLVSKVNLAEGTLGKLQPGRLYASFHFSIYAALYAALAMVDTQKRVLSLIGEQSAANQRALEMLAKFQGLNLVFVASGYNMLRELRVGRAQGTPVLILIDVPWSATNEVKDARYKFEAGTFLGFSAVERLVGKIDPEYQVIVPRVDNDQIHIDYVPGSNFSDYFAYFGSLVVESPTDYERLDRLHQYCEFDRPKSALVSFSIAASSNRYILHTTTMRTFEVKNDSTLAEALNSVRGVDCSSQALSTASAIVGGKLEYILSL